MSYPRVHAKRYSEILAVFTKYGFGFILEQLGLFKASASKKRAAKQNDAQETWGSAGKRLKLALEELGPAFVQLGQILSARADILPPAVAAELKFLQDSVQPIPFSAVRAVVESEFGEVPENIFAEFSKAPVAAASIAQVHRAKLASGAAVAVKVQRPGIEAVIREDLDILESIARFIDRRTKYGRFYDCTGMVEEFRATVQNELDFTKEAENADVLRKNFRQDEGIAVPAIRWIYTTKRVLTMEYMEGAGVQDGAVLDEWGLDRGRLAQRLAASVCSQILRDGFFHADPHPGNLRILRDGTIVFLDTGMVGRLGETSQRAVTRFFIGVTSKNSRMVVRAILDMDGASRHTGLKAFQKDMDRLIDKYLTRPINEIRIDELLFETFHTAFAHHVRIPREFAMLAKTLGTLQGTLETLDPKLNALAVAQPIAQKLLLRAVLSKRTGQKIKTDLLDYGELFSRLPGAALDTLDKLENGDLGLRLEFKNGDRLRQRLQAALDRITVCLVLLAVSMILSGVIIGSGVGANAGGELQAFNVLVLKSGLGLSAAIVLGLIFSILHSRR